MDKIKAAQKLEELKSSFDKQSKELMEIINKPTRVSSFLEACYSQGTTPDDEIPFSNPKNKRQRQLNGAAKLAIIRLALNRPGYEPNYSDRNEPKWKCYWDYRAGSGFVFYYSIAYYYYTFTHGGPLLDCETKEIADYFATQFQAEWKEYLEG